MTRPSGKPATITEVAKHAGVSLSTVSRVMNDNPTVDPALAERVRSSALELGYAASPLARSLVLGRTQTIAVVVPDLGNPTFQAVLRDSAAPPRRRGTTCSSPTRPSRSPRSACSRSRPGDGPTGSILCAPRMPSDELAALLPLVEPVVLVNRAVDGVPEHRSGLRDGPSRPRRPPLRPRPPAARLPLGPRAERVECRSSRGARGVPRRSTPTWSSRELASRRRLRQRRGGGRCRRGHRGDPAVLAFNDLVAMGLLSALADRGVPRAPRRLDHRLRRHPVRPLHLSPLTTASVPAAELGTLAWSAMNAALTGAKHPEPSVSHRK